MLTVGDKIEKFAITGIRPGATDNEEPPGAFEFITEESFKGWWKVFVFYPKDFTYICPTEIIGYDKLNKEFEDRFAVLMIGNTDNEYVKLAWKQTELADISCWMFADTLRDERSLCTQLGIYSNKVGACLRATFILDPDNVIQHVTVNSFSVGRSPAETLRTLDALQSGELCPCDRKLGGDVF